MRHIRAVLCGLAVALLVLLAPAAAGAQEEEEAPEAALLNEEAVEIIEESEEEGDLDHETAECAIHAIEENDADACHEAPSPILPELNELIWGGGAFLVLLLVLWKFGLPAAQSMMNERTERIRNDLESAERARVEAETVLADYQRQLADARNESARIVEEARQQAEQVRRDLTTRAETEASELRTRNAEQVAGERDRVLGELRTQVAGLAVELAEKVVESNLDRDTNLRLIENYIDSVGNGSRN
jgi:F-type H+-transporting ATPase subunit b